MKNDLQAIATMFSLINPAMCAIMFLQIAKDQDRQAQTVLATRTVAVIMAILILAAFFGSHVLHVFGISLDAFSVAGGAVLAWIGFSMLSGKGSVSTPASTAVSDPQNRQAVSTAPLILFAASPGTITGVITISVSHTGLNIPVTAIVAIITVLAVTWVAMVSSARFGGSGHGSGMLQDMTTRYMGLIVIAMGIQFALTGLKSFMGAG